MEQYQTFEERATGITRTILIVMLYVNLFAVLVWVIQAILIILLFSLQLQLYGIIQLFIYLFSLLIYGLLLKLSLDDRRAIAVRLIALLLFYVQVLLLCFTAQLAHFYNLFFIFPVICFFMFPDRYSKIRTIMIIIPIFLYYYWAFFPAIQSGELNSESIAPLIANIVISTIIFSSLIFIVYHFNRATQDAEKGLVEEYHRAESLLLNVLPSSIAERLKGGEGIISDYYNEVSILFSDLVGFTELTKRTEPVRLVELLNRIYYLFDEKCHELGLEKIKTMGDGYMAMGGGLHKQNGHIEQTIELGLYMIDCIKRINKEYNTSLEIRIGIHLGQAMAGVIGKTKFSYDLWGETVNIASRMESRGVPMRVHITDEVKSRLNGEYQIKSRGEIQVKGLGAVHTYLLTR